MAKHRNGVNTSRRRSHRNSSLRTALVISGGGSKGAFAVGVIKSIYDRFRDSGWFSIVGGSSTGALIAPAAALLGGPEHLAAEAMDVLVESYTKMTTTDVLERNSVIDFVHRRNCLNASDPLRRLVEERVTHNWFDWLASEDAPLCYVVYTNYRTGEKVAASPKDAGVTRNHFIEAMLASASVPVLMEPTIIDGDVCFDGGVRDVLPFSKAIELGAERIVPIFLDPERLEESTQDYRNLRAVAERTVMILLDEIARNDYEQARLVHQAVMLRQRLLSAFRNKRRARKVIESILSDDRFSDLFGNNAALVDVLEGLRPEMTLTRDYLDFDPNKMRAWMELGIKRAEAVVTSNPFGA